LTCISPVVYRRQAIRHVLQLKPGITDLASLVYRNEEELLGSSDHPEAYYAEVILPAKLALNVQYAQTRSFWSDIKLILLTVRYSLWPSGFEPARVLRSFPRIAPDILDSPQRRHDPQLISGEGASGTGAGG